MGRNKVVINGVCHYCLRMEVMTPEHLPPQKAFNDMTVVEANEHGIEYMDPDKPVKGRFQQGGVQFYRLCGKCNNDTGAWYADDYGQWVGEGLKVICSGTADGQQGHSLRFKPLNVLKQVVGFFLVINPPGLNAAMPELRKFVLDREERTLPQDLRFYCYLTTSDRCRFNALMPFGKAGQGTTRFVSDVTHIPFGYQMHYRTPSADPRLVDITDFTTAAYDEEKEWSLKLAELPVQSTLPDDFRTADEIRAAKNRPPGSALEPDDEDRVLAWRTQIEQALGVIQRLGMDTKCSGR